MRCRWLRTVFLRIFGPKLRDWMLSSSSDNICSAVWTAGYVLDDKWGQERCWWWFFSALSVLFCSSVWHLCLCVLVCMDNTCWNMCLVLQYCIIVMCYHLKHRETAHSSRWGKEHLWHHMLCYDTYTVYAHISKWNLNQTNWLYSHEQRWVYKLRFCFN